MEFEASTTIAATPGVVWETLIDGAAWPSWDSGVDAVEGTIAPGPDLNPSFRQFVDGLKARVETTVERRA